MDCLSTAVPPDNMSAYRAATNEASPHDGSSSGEGRTSVSGKL